MRPIAAAAAALRGDAPAAADGGASAARVRETLHRQTQEMYDAVAVGHAEVWERYLDAAAVLTTEDGTLLDKAQMVRQIRPLPPGVGGSIRVIDFKVALHGATAVATHVEDEDESYHGQALHCQYRSTDTWMQTPAGWRLVASQVIALRTDPPAIPLSAAQMRQLCGSYALNAAVHYEIRCTGGVLTGQQTDHQPETLRAEAPDVLFVPGRPRYRMIVERGTDGRVTGFAERREAWSLQWTRKP